jgi:hypothetical protein
MWDASKGTTTNARPRNEQGRKAEGKAEVKKGSPSVLSSPVDGIFASSPRLPFDFPALSLRKPERLCSQAMFFAPKLERRHGADLNSLWGCAGVHFVVVVPLHMGCCWEARWDSLVVVDLPSPMN